MCARETILNFSDIYKCVIPKYESVVFHVHFWLFIDTRDVSLPLTRNSSIKEPVVTTTTMSAATGFRGTTNNETCFSLQNGTEK